MTGFNISKTGKEFGFVDLVLESSFFDSKNTFKSGFGLRVFLKDGFNLVIDGRYNFSDEFSNFSAGIEKEFGPCFLNMFYSWSDLVVDVDIYSIGLKWNFK
ncbi:hypothetical protein KAJ27_07900 [bacterium]|nr:hypothetical protein [bacterium]